MKKNIRIILSLFIYSSITLNLSAQMDTIKAHYNKTKEQISIEKNGINSKKEFKITVDSVNTVLHKVVFKFKDFQLVSEAPSGLKILSDIKTNENINLGRGIISLNESSDLLVKIEKVIAETNFFIKNFNSIYQYKKAIEKIENKIKDEGQKISKIESLSKNYKDVWIDLLLVNFPDVLCNYQCVEKLKKEIDQKYKDKSYEKKDTILKESIRHKLESKSNKNKYDSLYKNEKRFITFTNFKVNSLLTFYETLDEQSKNVSDVSLEVIEAKSRLKQYYLELKKITLNLLSGLLAIEKGATGNIKFNIKSKPHLSQKDFTSAEIIIVDRFSLDTIAKTKTDLFAKNKFRIDFSTGLSGNTLVQKEYFFTKTDSLKTGINSEKSAGIDFGIAALMHFDFKMSPSLAFGPVIGASISLIDENPRFIGGLSGTIGKHKSISITAGINVGKIKVLSKQVSSNGMDFNKEIDLEQFETVPLASKIKSGFFFGITYNLTRKKK